MSLVEGQSKVFELTLSNVGRINVHEYGEGNELLIAFHGYGMTGRQFLASKNYLVKNYQIVAMDLFFHGETKLANHDPKKTFFTKRKLYELIDLLIKRYGVKKFSVAGYSLGAKAALCAVEHFSTRLNRCYLLAPDGLKYEPLVYVFNRTFLFNRLFKHHRNIIQMFKFFRKIGLIDDGLLKIIIREIDTPEKIINVHYTLKYLSKIQPDISIVQKQLVKDNIHTILVSGKSDYMFPPRKAKKFLKPLKRKNHFISNSGHWVFSKDLDEQLSVILRGSNTAKYKSTMLEMN